VGPSEREAFFYLKRYRPLRLSEAPGPEGIGFVGTNQLSLVYSSETEFSLLISGRRGGNISPRYHARVFEGGSFRYLSRSFNSAEDRGMEACWFAVIGADLEAFKEAKQVMKKFSGCHLGIEYQNLKTGVGGAWWGANRGPRW